MRNRNPGLKHTFMNYSVPYEYIKQKVDVRLTKRTVEVFFKGTRIASHPRLYGYHNQYSTLETHMPEEHKEYQQWNGTRFLLWADKIGKNTSAVIRSFLTTHPVEQQGYKTCMALLKLTDKYPPQRLEAACKKALSFTPSPSYKIIASILKSGQDRIEEDKETGESGTHREASKYSFTRGAEYYRRDE